VKITFGMPHLLALYSLAIYQQSLTISMTTLAVAVLSSAFCYITGIGEKSSTNVEISKKEIL
tara:strand:+ start:577 stop:762 length:186 start_codon:yes stop_codon:yes gene_type:complete